MTGLTRAHFAISIDGRRVSPHFDGQNLPASILFLVDVSGSVSPGKPELDLELTKELRLALAAFLKVRTSPSEVAVATFAETPTLVADYTRDVAPLLRALEKPLSFHGRTALHDSVGFALETLARASYRRRVLVIITDGNDNRSKASLKAIRRKLEESDVVVYTVAMPSPDLEQATFFPYAGLRLLAEETGGVLVQLSRRVRLADTLAALAKELNLAYTLSIPAPGGQPDKRYSIKVQLMSPTGADEGVRKLVVRSRKAFRQAGVSAAQRPPN